jgi:hypothetical protein
MTASGGSLCGLKAASGFLYLSPTFATMLSLGYTNSLQRNAGTAASKVSVCYHVSVFIETHAFSTPSIRGFRIFSKLKRCLFLMATLPLRLPPSIKQMSKLPVANLLYPHRTIHTLMLIETTYQLRMNTGINSGLHDITASTRVPLRTS